MESTALKRISFLEFQIIIDKLKESFKFEFEAEDFDGSWIKNLPDADLVNENKTTKSGHTSHIAVTSASMELFPIKKNKNDSTWRKVEILLLKEPIKETGIKLNFIKSYFSMREAYDKNNKHQVYISSKEYDEKSFYDLRRMLHLNDQIWFLKLKGENKFVVFSIKEKISRSLFLEDRFLFISNERLESGSISQFERLRLFILRKTKENYSISIETLIDSAINEFGILYSKDKLIFSIDDLVSKNKISKNILSGQVYYSFVDNNLVEYASEIIDNESEPNQVDDNNEINLVNSIQKNKRIKTSKEVRLLALERAGYECEFAKLINQNHTTFLTKSDKNYVEAHHLVRMCDQRNSLFVRNEKYINLDNVNNIISLCPNCHAKIHLGRNEEITKMLTLLYEKRKKMLEESKIFISLQELIDFYTN